MTNKPSFPPVALALGLGGLIPFWALAIALVSGATAGVDPTQIAGLLIVYGAIILSFLGGIRWGIGVVQDEEGRSRRNFLISVVPALLAWGVFLLPPDWRLATLSALMLALGLFDYGLVCREEAPEWFGTLRLILAAAAALALIIAAVFG